MTPEAKAELFGNLILIAILAIPCIADTIAARARARRTARRRTPRTIRSRNH